MERTNHKANAEKIETKIKAINAYLDKKNSYNRFLLETRDTYKVFVLMEGTKEQVSRSCAKRTLMKCNYNEIEKYLDGFCMALGMVAGPVNEAQSDITTDTIDGVKKFVVHGLLGEAGERILDELSDADANDEVDASDASVMFRYYDTAAEAEAYLEGLRDMDGYLGYSLTTVEQHNRLFPHMAIKG